MPEFYQDVLSALTLASVAYLATNIDNLMILSLFLQRHRNKAVAIGSFVLVSAAVLVFATAFSAIAWVIPPHLLGWLGVIPILLGLRMLLRKDAAPGIPKNSALSGGSLAAVLLGNSADTLAAFGPLFAESEARVVVTLAVGYALTAAISLVVVTRVFSRLSAASTITRTGAKLLPYVIIAIGVYVLLDTGTDTL